METQLETPLSIREAAMPTIAQPVLPTLIEQTARKVFESFSEKVKTALNGRDERALKLALNGSVVHKGARVYSVRSEEGGHAYLVNLEAKTCNCPDSLKGNACKHRLAAYLMEQAEKVTQELSPPTPAIVPEPSKRTPPPISNDETIEKARLALHARSEFLRESIVYAVLNLDGQPLEVEILDIEEETAVIRALPKLAEGKLIPQFPFPEKKSFAQVIAKSLSEVKIYR